MGVRSRKRGIRRGNGGGGGGGGGVEGGSEGVDTQVVSHRRAEFKLWRWLVRKGAYGGAGTGG